MYDYYLGGRDNYEVDRHAAEEVLRFAPSTRVTALANRAFMRRAVRAVVGAGVRQIIDIGTGIPTSPNPHEIAREIDPAARVAFVDNDVIVATHADAKLAGESGTAFVHADLRDPRSILESPALRDLIDFGEPVALMLVAVLHFVEDAADPAGIVAALGEGLPSGSHLILSHVTADFHGGEQEIARRDDPGVGARKVYERTAAAVTLRDRNGVARFFEGWDLLEPGLVQASAWRPELEPEDAGHDAAEAEDGTFQDAPGAADAQDGAGIRAGFDDVAALYAGVARKP
ncbi:SAM-dependent methyltransferase [Streptomyces sp. PLAI1-29]|uniref:SAM-dependent methyltransferase n=2 Tax=Streptomyces zingiberis TaxID=2053010 RepID=A0ABX1C1X9_9ACTN|nr:SAM-dependent methyltransferase [Streptomyces zingiberis]